MAKSLDLAGKLKGATVGVAIGLAALLGGAEKSVADWVPLEFFGDFSYGYVTMIETDRGPPPDNLKIRDRETGEDKVVEGLYHLGFLKKDDLGYSVVGWAGNYYRSYEGYEGWLQGNYFTTQTWSGEKPDSLWIVHDKNEDGMGIINTQTGEWIKGEDDTIYFPSDILFGPDKIRGDVSFLPTLSESWTIPSMTIAPEYIYDTYGIRQGPSNKEDLVKMAEFWLTEGEVFNPSSLDYTDWNSDGVVNMEDLALLSKNYEKEE